MRLNRCHSLCGKLTVLASSFLYTEKEVAVKQITYPYVKELITDAKGRVTKVVMRLDDYRRLLEAVEDEALVRAMQEVEHEKPMSKEEALRALEEA